MTATARRSAQVAWTIVDPAGRNVGTVLSAPADIAPGATHGFDGRANVTAAALWSLEDPKLYRVVAEVRAGGRAVDRAAAHFGIRSIRFDPDKGFFLNGEPVKIKGTCNHQDHAGVGCALPDRLQYCRIEKLKEMGSNGYRTSHNPPTPELLDACDRLGMLVLDENPHVLIDAEGLSQLERMIRRDRNHPSVMFWSTGNEEPHARHGARRAICATMKRLASRLDPTAAHHPPMDKDWGKGITPVLDIMGFNYHTPKMDEFHAIPGQPVLGTETGSTVCTRGIYAARRRRRDTSGLRHGFSRGGPRPRKTGGASSTPRPFIAGGFVWTGFDYRGEPTPLRLAECVVAIRHHGYLRLPQGQLVLLLAHGGRTSRCCTYFRIGTGRAAKVSEIGLVSHQSTTRRTVPQRPKRRGARRDAQSHVEWTVPYAPGMIEARGVTRRRQGDDGDAARPPAHPPRSGSRPTAQRSAPTAKTLPSLPWRSWTRRAASCRRPTTGLLQSVRPRKDDRRGQWRSQQPRAGQGVGAPCVQRAVRGDRAGVQDCRTNSRRCEFGWSLIFVDCNRCGACRHSTFCRLNEARFQFAGGDI